MHEASPRFDLLYEWRRINFNRNLVNVNLEIVTWRRNGNGFNQTHPWLTLCLKKTVVLWNRHDNVLNIHTISELLFLIAQISRLLFYKHVFITRTPKKWHGMPCQHVVFMAWFGACVPASSHATTSISVWLQICHMLVDLQLTFDREFRQTYEIQIQLWWIQNLVELVLVCQGTKWYITC